MNPETLGTCQERVGARNAVLDRGRICGRTATRAFNDTLKERTVETCWMHACRYENSVSPHRVPGGPRCGSRAARAPSPVLASGRRVRSVVASGSESVLPGAGSNPTPPRYEVHHRGELVFGGPEVGARQAHEAAVTQWGAEQVTIAPADQAECRDAACPVHGTWVEEPPS